MWQQVVVYVCVALAAIYLGRYLYDSVRAIVKARSGCGDGCSKCAFAAQPPKRAASRGSSAPGAIIPLSDVRAVPPRKV